MCAQVFCSYDINWRLYYSKLLFLVLVHLLAPAVTVGERRELWIPPPFSSFAYNFVRK